MRKHCEPNTEQDYRKGIPWRMGHSSEYIQVHLQVFRYLCWQNKTKTNHYTFFFVCFIQWKRWKETDLSDTDLHTWFYHLCIINRISIFHIMVIVNTRLLHHTLYNYLVIPAVSFDKSYQKMLNNPNGWERKDKVRSPLPRRCKLTVLGPASEDTVPHNPKINGFVLFCLWLTHHAYAAHTARKKKNFIAHLNMNTLWTTRMW